jgi:hypothetical protein
MIIDTANLLGGLSQRMQQGLPQEQLHQRGGRAQGTRVLAGSVLRPDRTRDGAAAPLPSGSLAGSGSCACGTRRNGWAVAHQCSSCTG